MRLRSVLLLAAAGGLAMLAGCGSTGVAVVRIIQVSPGTGSIDAFVSDLQVANALTYGTATSYVQISDGSHTVALSPAGQDKTTLYKQVVAVYANTYLTIFAVNPSSSIAELVLTDNDTAPDTGDFKLRIVNVSPSAPGPVDVYVTAPSTSITDVPATFRNVSYQTAETYLQLPAGSYEVRFTTAGTKTVIADTAAFTPAVGDIDTVALADAPGGGAPFQAYDYVDATFSNNNPTTQ
jgi:hypothetical protein